jgi:Tfp pilus assembly protein PilF
MKRDRYGLPLSTVSEAAASDYGEGLDLLLSAWAGAEQAMDRAIAADPNFALPCIARARLYQVHGRVTEARAGAARARQLAANATDRERGHVNALASSIEGEPAAALAPVVERHLDDHPRDAMILSMLLGAFGLYAFSGRPDHDQAKLAICERLAPQYGDDWWFMAYRGWSNTEAGNVSRGLELAQRSLELRQTNGHGAHAMAHTLFEQGDATTGSRFLADWLDTHPRSGFMHGHLVWHRALMAVEANDSEGALRIFEKEIGPAVSDAPPINVLSDGASLLWRLVLHGRQVPSSLWKSVVDYGEQRFPKAGGHFADIHYALAAAAAGDDRLGYRLSAMEQVDAAGKLAPGPTAISICRAAHAFADGDNLETIRILEPLMPEVVRIGGSHAQRELWEDTLIVAYLRAQQTDKARQAIDRRLHRRPSAIDRRWLTNLGGTTPAH